MIGVMGRWERRGRRSELRVASLKAFEALSARGCESELGELREG